MDSTPTRKSSSLHQRPANGSVSTVILWLHGRLLDKLATRAGSRRRGRTCATNGPRDDLPPSIHPAPCVYKNRCLMGGMAVTSENKSSNGSHNGKVSVDPRGDFVQNILTEQVNIIQPFRPSCPQFTVPTIGREFCRQKRS